MVPMEALARQTYDGRALKRGDSFAVHTEAEADDLEAIRWAKRVKRVAVPTVTATIKTDAYTTRVVGPEEGEDPTHGVSDPSPNDSTPTDVREPEESPNPVQAANTHNSKRDKYNRRDMRAR